jgi:hypothetical protein
MMSTELERQLRRTFARLPQPTRESTRRARAAALATLPADGRRAGVGLLLAAAAVALLVGAGAAALAATGNLHVRLGRQNRSSAPPAHLTVPAGTHGFAVVAGGKLWLTTRRGLRIEGLPVSTAELSPRALYAVVGIGSSLVTMAPGHRRPWTHDAGGRVLAASWSPDGLKIAYVVRRGRHDELRLIEGDGDHDRLLAPRVSPAKPSWRGDALALGYVGAGGRPAVYDLNTESRHMFDTRNCGGRARAVAYAPAARRLAVATTSGVAVIERWSRLPTCLSFDRSRSVNSVAWLRSGQLLSDDSARTGTGAAAIIRRFEWDRAARLNEVGASFWPKSVRAIAAGPGGGAVAVAVARPKAIEVFLVSAPERAGGRVRPGRPLVRLAGNGTGVSLSWR